jgi:hypothetical protein
MTRLARGAVRRRLRHRIALPLSHSGPSQIVESTAPEERSQSIFGDVCRRSALLRSDAATPHDSSWTRVTNEVRTLAWQRPCIELS